MFGYGRWADSGAIDIGRLRLPEPPLLRSGCISSGSSPVRRAVLDWLGVAGRCLVASFLYKTLFQGLLVTQCSAPLTIR